jgi:hypothetical protein
MAPRKNQGDTLDRGWQLSDATSATTVSLDPGVGALRHWSDERPRHAPLTPMRNAMISMGVIDEKSFTPRMHYPLPAGAR